ncbi:MAG: L-serine ammonia-lyase, iron-sulfur-dependent, subunit alpha [Oscillospiraceae bacterium]|nr:L-serine ammonia-lyase, iron-sulfur-dependent, subunit alpha [Oscillospiraceae bacterium]
MKSIREIYKVGKGPSSSHTIGPEQAAGIFRDENPDADAFQVKLYGSLCKTGKGHGTDRVLHEVLSPVPTEVVFCQETPSDVEHPNTLDFTAYQNGAACGTMRAVSVGGGDIRIVGREEPEDSEIYPENTFAEVEQFCRFRNLNLAEYVEFNEGSGIWDFLETIWRAMKQSVQDGLHAEGFLPGPLQVERKAKMLYEHVEPTEVPQVRECRIISSYAYAVSEQNADCGTIVTAPTCGSCGVIPAALLYMQQQRNFTDEQMLPGLAVAGLIGNLIKHNASISGAECGCQAEIGSACSMAAAALAFLFGLKTDQIQYAAEIALEHHLGLTCDPICGMVQVPCIERNAVAAMRAMNACNLAYFLADTQRISFDIVVRTMYETGISMNQRFRETAEGGLAKMFERRRR